MPEVQKPADMHDETWARHLAWVEEVQATARERHANDGIFAGVLLMAPNMDYISKPAQPDESVGPWVGM